MVLGSKMGDLIVSDPENLDNLPSVTFSAKPSLRFILVDLISGAAVDEAGQI